MSTKKTALGLLGALLVGGVAVYLARGPASTAAPGRPRRESLLLVTLDTTRADRLGAYGYAAARTPHLDRLAREGVRFDQALSPVPITLPSHVSLFTAVHPPVHGIRNNGRRFGEALPTLATALRARGHRTAAFVSAFVLDERFGLNRGFETYDDEMETGGPEREAIDAERRGDRTAAALVRWLEGQSNAAPFFAWLHLYDPHDPYLPPAPFDKEFASSPYDGEIALTDQAVGSALDALARTGLADRTLVAVVGDHGESLGEHGEDTHGMFVYEAAIRVPLVLWGPGVVGPGRVVPTPVRTIDLAPTLLALLGAPPLPKAEGQSLVPLLEGRRAGRGAGALRGDPAAPGLHGLGPTACRADGAMEAHRRAAAGAVRPAAGPEGGRQPIRP